MIKYYGNLTLNKRQSFAGILLIILLIVNISVPLWTNAQNTTTQPTSIPDSTIFKQTPLAIPLSSVADESQKATLKISDIKSRIEAVSIDINIDSLLPVISSNIDALMNTAFKNNELQNFSLRSLKDYYTDFSQMNIQLKNVKSEVINEYNGLQPDADLTDQLQKTWNATSDNLSKQDVPEEIHDRINSVLNDIKNLKTEISGKQNKFLIYENRVTYMMTGLEETMGKISAEIKIQGEQFLKQNSQPIWRQLIAHGDTVSFKANSNASFERQKKNTKMFLENYGDSIQHQLTFLVLFFILLLFFKKQVKALNIDKKDNTLVSALQVIDLPFVSALTITIVITPFYYPVTSETVSAFVLVFFIIPIIFLLPRLIPYIKKGYFYLFGLLFILNVTYLIFQSYYLIGRLLLIFYSLVAVLVLLLALRPQTSLSISLRAKKMDNLIFIMHASIVLYAVALVGNIFGFTVLSNQIIDGCFVIYFVGILILTGASVLKSLVALFMISKVAQKLNIVKLFSNEIKRWLNQVINIIAIVYFAVQIMKTFYIYYPTVKWFTNLITNKWEIGDVGISFGSIFIFFITIWVSFFLSKIIKIVLQDEILARLHMKKGVPEAISMMVSIVLGIIGVVLACSVAGINLSNITIIFGALGVGVGFGLQDIVRNFISGIILVFERPIRKGDVITLSDLDLMGEVMEIGVRATIIKTYDGTDVIVPNGNLISSDLINCTLNDRTMRRELLIGVEYGNETNRVLEILNTTVASNKNVFKEPAPWIIFTGFGENSLNFKVTFWADFDAGLDVLSAVGGAINDAFKKEGITIAYPQRVLHMSQQDETLAQEVEKLKNDPKNETQNVSPTDPVSKPKSE